MSQHETFICIVLSEVSQIYSKFIIMIVMIIIMASVVMLFHYGISELERFESVTFIVLHHCPAVLTTFAGWAGASRGGAGRGCKGVSRGVGASIPAMDSKTSAETTKPSVLLCNHHLVDRLKRLQR